MECSDAREALSAWADGETSPHDEAAVRAHVAGCAECAAFAELAGALAMPREEAPDLAPAVMARLRRKRDSRVFVLRWGVGMMGGAELANALYELIAHGGSEVHATHESLSFTIAICLGLLLAAFRPWQARGYVPVMGTAVALLLLTASFDVATHAIAWYDELPHVDLLAGLIFLWLLGREDTGGPAPRRGRRTWRLWHRGTASYGGLRVVSRTALARTVRPAKVALGTLIASAVLVVVAGPASAHAVLEGSDPGPDAVVATLPAQVSLSFSEPVTLPDGGTQVFGPDGKRVDAGGASVHGGEIDIPLAGGGAEGTYVVSFRIVSADSHPVAGAFSFSVGAPSATPVVPQSANTRGLSIALGVGRWISYAGMALLVGGLVFLGRCWPGGWEVRRVVALPVAGAALVAVAALASLLVKGPLDAGGGNPLSPALLDEVLGATYGRAVLTRALLAVLALALLLGRHGLGRRDLLLVGALLSIALAVTFGLAGHAAAGEQRWLTLASVTVHVLAMSVWVGGLALLVTGAVWRLADARAIVQRFSGTALASVAALVMTGLFQSWRQVGSIDAFTATTYGRELAVKAGLVIMAFGVAAGSRSLLHRSGGLASLRQSVGIEVVLAGGVLAVTAALVATQPAKSAYRPTVAESLSLAGDAVQVSAVPTADRQADLHLYTFDSSGQPSDPAEITASMVLPAQGIGPVPVELQDAGPGHRQALLSVPVAGVWRLSVTVRTSDFDEETGYVEVPVR